MFQKSSQEVRLGIVALVTTLFIMVNAPHGVAAKPPHAGPKPANEIKLVPTITSISIQNGGLVASGIATARIHGKTATAPFTVPVDIALAEDQTGAGACPILALTLAPIQLDLLGLVVETSPICLNVTAYAGGGLLGDLLCGVANLLQAGLPLDLILSGLTPTEIERLLDGLENSFNLALPELLDAILTAIFPGTGAACAILHLELGPVDLTLLGLRVILDDCNGDPVVVDITAERGVGNLLGNLLCGLLGDGLISLGSTLQAILGQLLGILSA